jgi:LysR family glycine cleavage system transcriptional activator
MVEPLQRPLAPLRAIQAFEAIVRLGTVTRAAQELGVSPGALSQQVKVLETFLGVQLLERSGRGVVPTIWGRKYLPGIAEGFSSLRRAQRFVQQQKLDTEIRISAPASISTRWLAARLFEWSSRHRQNAFQLRASDAEPDLQSDEADLRVTYGDHVLVHAHYAMLFVDAVTPVLSPRLAATPLSDPVALLDYPLIGVDWGPDIDAPPPSWQDWFVGNGVTTAPGRTALTFSLSSTAIDAAVSGNGVALAQMSMVSEDLAAGRLVAPFPDRTLDMPKPYYLAWAASALAKPGCKEMQSWLKRRGRAG